MKKAKPMPKQTVTDIDCELVHETAKAWLLDFGDKKDWIPKSVGELDVNEDGIGTVALPINYAKAKELI